MTPCDAVSQQCDRLCDVPSQRAERVPAAEARQRIAAATERLLRDRRFRDLTVEDVMAEAGLARTVFYRHFDGLPGVVTGLLDELLAAIVALADDDPDDRETLRRQLALAVDTFREHGPLLLALDEAARHDHAVEAAYRAWFDLSVDVSAALVQRGVDRGHTPPLAVHAVTRALTAMNASYLLDLVARDPAFDADVALDALWTVWSRTTWPAT